MALNTPAGMRHPEEPELTALNFGASRLARYIAARLHSELHNKVHEGVILKAVRENSPFHALNARTQLVSLHFTMQGFCDPNNQLPTTQFVNSTLECVYSCLFYEIKKEIEALQRGEKPVARSVRHKVYSAWEYWFHSTDKLLIASTNLDDWVKALDKLASRSVYDPTFAKQFDVGYMPDVTDQMVRTAVSYFE